MAAINPGYSVEAYRGRLIVFNPHAVKNTGIKQNQTVLKLDTYNIIAVPYRMSVSNVVLLAFLSGDELTFFQKYIGSLCSLSLVFQRPDQLETLKLFVRCTLLQIGQMKGRDNVGLINLEMKSCPNDLLAIIAEYLVRIEQLKTKAEDYRDKPVSITAENARALQYNNYALLSAGSGEQRIRVFALCSNQIDFLSLPDAADIPVGTKLRIKLFFQQYQFTVGGSVTAAARLPSGVLRVKAALEFSLELTEILEHYYLVASTPRA